ncbi:polyribonucleotide nucleotidyltransferase, partial [Plakobranchus ocellatus]
MNIIKITKEFQGRELTLETGKLAKQAGGSVFASWGETQVLATATMGQQKVDRDFFPLSVDYIEKFYANGKIPGSYMKREAKPSNEEVHIARLIDRPLRPLFSNEIRNEIQIIITVMSLDKKTPSDILALIAASAALMISDIPFEKAVGAVRVGYIDGKLVINPLQDDLSSLDLDLIVAGTDSAITMIEGGGNEIPEDKVLLAVKEAHEVIKALVDFQLELVAKAQKPKKTVELFTWSDELKKALEEKYFNRLQAILNIPSKIERENKRATLYEEIQENFNHQETLPVEQIRGLLYKMESSIVRDMILNKNQRPDGRELTALRDLHCAINTLAKPHGSALFTRGETQALGIVTIGSEKDKQKIDLTKETYNKDFLLHYNFPPFSVGEVSRLVSIGRREIGHGILAERSLQFTLPKKEDYDFTIRLVAEILESNGSSSMAT